MREVRYFRSFDSVDFDEERGCKNHEMRLYKQCAELIFSICKAQGDGCNGCPIREQCGEHSWCPETWEFN